MRLLVVFIVLLLPIGQAQARWLEASSDHFVVYADDSPRDIQKFSEQLERFHAAIALTTNVDMPKPSPSNRVTIYVVDNVRDVRELAHSQNKYLG